MPQPPHEGRRGGNYPALSGEEKAMPAPVGKYFDGVTVPVNPANAVQPGDQTECDGIQSVLRIGGSYNNLTDTVREEWGFEGRIVTGFSAKEYVPIPEGVTAGNVLFTVSKSASMNGLSGTPAPST